MAALAASNADLEASRDRDIHKASWAACLTLPGNYGGVLKAPKKKWEKKKKETMPEFHLH
ncbi:hypothetical protein Bca4012_006351 [Brassica carinata]|uniref:Uncharacterized protein n=1 Tax=Brassica oleracea TaxID=3712 RepID=A0A3P6ASL2_BRAOL|nr:unnamed protein product [Brassica oleracea]